VIIMALLGYYRVPGSAEPSEPERR
jgi:hypothetical protein